MLKALYYPGDVPFDSLFIPAIYHEIYYDGVYMDVLNDIDHNKKDPIIVDVGSNIGITVQYFRDHAKKVYAIEPASENFEALKANKENNGWDNVEIFNFAISNEDGETTLRRNKNNLTMNSIAVDYNERVSGKEEIVKTKTFATFFKENNITHVDFMKFDVEGAEELILPTKDFEEASKIIDNIEIEFHFPDFTKHVNHLIELGYTARRYNCNAVVVDFNK
jgi:FkbM family methyltransferase